MKYVVIYPLLVLKFFSIIWSAWKNHFKGGARNNSGKAKDWTSWGKEEL